MEHGATMMIGRRATSVRIEEHQDGGDEFGGWFDAEDLFGR